MLHGPRESFAPDRDGGHTAVAPPGLDVGDGPGLEGPGEGLPGWYVHNLTQDSVKSSTEQGEAVFCE